MKINVTIGQFDDSKGSAKHYPFFDTLFIRNLCLFDSRAGFFVCYP